MLDAKELDCNRLWLLKNSVFVKTAEIWGIENVYTNRDTRPGPQQVKWGVLKRKARRDGRGIFD
jgi:hypothetical protein